MFGMNGANPSWKCIFLIQIKFGSMVSGIPILFAFVVEGI